MAALYEGFTLCGLAAGKSRENSGLLGIEPGRDPDHVIVTGAGRTVTVYKVSDQKPLGSWAAKQGQAVTCPAVLHGQTGEYVAVQDSKVLRIWRDEDINFEKVFKATLSAAVSRIHALPSLEPLVLFQRGAVRQLDALLAAPQQAVEEVLSEDEVIRWSSCFLEAEQPLLLFSTEKSGECFLYLQKLKPNVLHKYSIDSEGKGACPISFTATLENKCITLMCLYSSGCVYKLLVSLHPSVEGEQHLPKSLLLKLPVSEGVLSRAAITSLEEGHIAIVGSPHSASTGDRDFLCIWNTNFQTLQASKELAGGAYGQLWCNAGKLYVTHGKVLTVLPYRCEMSSLAAALGKLKQTSTQEVTLSPSELNWNSLLHEETALQPRTGGAGMRTRNSKQSLTSQATLSPTINQVLEDLKGVSSEEVEEVLEPFLSCSPVSPQFQLGLSHITVELLKRCQADPGFYPQTVLARLAQTGRLSHSSCPGFLMLALEKRDYFLAQLCLQQFPDVPEAVTCACLKAFLSVADADLVPVNVDLEGVSLVDGPGHSLEGVQNGFSPVLLEEDGCDVQLTAPKLDQSSSWIDMSLTRPVGLKKSALLNEILRSSYSESFLLPHLKDLSSRQVILFLRYLQYLYVRSSGDVYTQLPGLRAPTVTQIMDWVSLLLDAHFTVLIMASEAKGLLTQLHRFVRSQVRLYSELGKIQGTLQELGKINKEQEIGLYSIEVIELF